jgi:arsenate reductase-like glutaredoxin family protein
MKRGNRNNSYERGGQIELAKAMGNVAKKGDKEINEGRDEIKSIRKDITSSENQINNLESGIDREKKSIKDRENKIKDIKKDLGGIYKTVQDAKKQKAKFAKGGFITFSDGYKFQEVSKSFAEKNWDKIEIYGINISEESEGLIDSKNDIEDYDNFGIEHEDYAKGGEVGKTYQIKGADVTFYEDSYEEGEQDQFHSYYLGENDFPYKTKFTNKKDLFETLNDFVSYADMKEEDFYVDEDTIQTSALVKHEKGSDWDEFSAPTEKEIELWKKGEMKLYSAQFLFPYEVYKKEKLEFAKGGEVEPKKDSPFSVEVWKSKARYNSNKPSLDKEVKTYSEALEIALSSIEDGAYKSQIMSQQGYLWEVDEDGVQSYAKGGKIEVGDVVRATKDNFPHSISGMGKGQSGKVEEIIKLRADGDDGGVAIVEATNGRRVEAMVKNLETFAKGGEVSVYGTNGKYYLKKYGSTYSNPSYKTKKEAENWARLINKGEYKLSNQGLKYVEEKNRFAKGGKTQGKIYKIQEKSKYDLGVPKWKDEKFLTGGKKYLSYKDAQDEKNKLQRMSSSIQYKVVEWTPKLDFAKGGSIKDMSFGEFYDYLQDKGEGDWDNVNSEEIVRMYIDDMNNDGIDVSHIEEVLENNPSREELYEIWLGNSMNTPTPINTKEELLEALELDKEDFAKGGEISHQEIIEWLEKHPELDGYNEDGTPTDETYQDAIEEIKAERGYAKGGEVKKKGNEEHNTMLIGGIAGILLGIFLGRK